MAETDILQQLVKVQDQNKNLNELLLTHIAGQAERDKKHNELLLAHIANQADRDARHQEEIRTRDDAHKKELQLAEERGAAQIAELKLHRKSLHAEILGREVSNHTDTDTDTNTNTNINSEAISNQINNQISINTTSWKKVAEGLVEFRSNNHKSNEFHVKRIFAENAAFLAPILAICPKVKILLANVLTNSVTLKRDRARVSPGSEASRLKNLTEAEGERKKWKSFNELN